MKKNIPVILFIAVSLALSQTSLAAESAPIPTSASANVQITIGVRDSGSDVKGNGNGKIDPGEQIQLSVSVANLGDREFPGSQMLFSSNKMILPGNLVELPALGLQEGVTFELGLHVGATPEGAALSVSLSTPEGRGLQEFAFVVSDGTLVQPGIVEAPVWAETPSTKETGTHAPPLITGRIMGEVLSLDTGNPLSGAIITLQRMETAITQNVEDYPTITTTITNSNGRYLVDLLAGLYTLRLTTETSGMQSREGIKLGINLARRIDFTVADQNTADVEEVVVFGQLDLASSAVQLVIRKKKIALVDSISAEEIARSGDSSASQAVRRSVGTSVVGGKYIYVRGLGERYAYTLLDGIKLPSPEPDKKVVPLDIFPTSLIAAVSVAKTFSPELPADFAGGAVQIESRQFPAKRVLSVEMETGFNSLTTFQDMPAYNGGRFDWTGFSVGNRAFPASLPDDSVRLMAGSRYSTDDMVKIGREFNNDFALSTRTGLPKMKGSLTWGDTVHTGRQKIGFLTYASFGNDFQRILQVRRKNRIRDNGRGGIELDTATDFKGESGTQKISFSAMGSLAYEPISGQVLQLVSMLTNRAEIEGRFLGGFEQQYNGTLDYTSLRYIRRQLWYNRLGGQHALGAFSLDWYGSANWATRDEPDWRELVRTRSEGSNSPSLWLVKSSSGSHFWSYLSEPGYQAGTNLDWSFGQWSGLESHLKVGGLASTRHRDFSVRRLRLLQTAESDPAHLSLPVRALLNDGQIGKNIRLEETSRPTDSYLASENVLAAYVGMELPLAVSLKVAMGGRFEYSVITVTTFDPFATGSGKTDTNLANRDFLPTMALVYNLAENQNLKLAVSRTVARPDFHELSPFALANFYGGQEIKGNPALKETHILNADIRWEMFPDQREVLAISVYGKWFQNPIEQIIIPSGQQTISYANAHGARLGGIEIEMQQGLGFVFEGLENFYMGNNLTLGYSAVWLDPASGIQTNSRRSLQGQSDVLANFNIGFANDTIEIQTSYNVFSRRIAQAGAFGMPDTFELPFHDLSFNGKYNLGDQWSIGLSVGNMLARLSRYEQGDRIVRSDDQGVNTGLSLKYTY